MLKNIFSKYFAATASIISVAFVLLAFVQTFFGSRYWISEKRDAMEKSAFDIAEFLEESVQPGINNTYFLPDSLPALRHLANATESDLLVCNSEGTVLLCSHAGNCPHRGKTLPHDFMKESPLSPSFFTVSHLGDLYTEEQYVVRVPFGKNGVAMGYAVLASSASGLREYILHNLYIFLISGIAVLLFAFIVQYIITYRLVRPLKEMATATRQFSRGDFSARVKVRGKDEVAELAQALNGMASSLSSVEEMRRSFVTNVSHDLRTPMTTISGFIDGILDGTIPPEEHRHYLHIVSDETKRLSRLVRTMLDLSRIDSGQLTLHPMTFDFTELVCTTLLTLEKRIEDKAITVEELDTCGPESVNADFDLIGQVVYNLLDNAVKFTDTGGKIRIRISHDEHTVICSVRNTGEGIPSTELPHIFERFYKSDRSRSLDKSGTGLGLYIVKTIIDMHGGEITVRSVPQEYCDFTFRLPINL